MAPQPGFVMNNRVIVGSLVVGVVLIAASGAAAGKDQKPKKVERIEVCFDVHNTVRGNGDPTTYQVSGTLHSPKNSKGGGTALLLVHAAVSDRSVWDGARPAVTGAPSMAEQLAGAGYDVFAIDRLGYARSPYPGSGWALTADGNIDMINQMVSQIREGTYGITADTCDGAVEAGRAADKVVLMGHSSGAGMIEYYATRHHDVDGIVPLMWSNQGTSFEYFQAWTATVTPQLAQGKDYIHYFSVGPDGYSQACEDWLLYTKGISEDVLAQTCGPGYIGGDDPPTTPSGEATTVVPVMERVMVEIGNVGPTPTLLVFADMDAIFPGPEFGGDEDVVTPEIEMWRTRCNCDVEVLWQENAGHFGMVHDSAPETATGIVEWLRSRRL